MKYFFLCFFLLAATFTFSQQSKKEQLALDMGIQAIKCMNDGNFDEAIVLLEQAQKLDPIRIDYPYEMAYALYNLKEYDKVIDILEKLKERQEASDLVFQLLGNTYHNAGNPERALVIYQKGLNKFPESGHLYLEIGIVEYSQENFNEAIINWENGIRVQPDLSSNYYWLGRAFAGSNKRIWGILYSELFILLETESARSREMSEILFRIYDASISFDTDTTVTTHFESAMQIDPTDNKGITLPFDSEVELITSMSSLNVSGKSKDHISLDDLVNIRTAFIDNWHTMNMNDKYSNCLFDFHSDMKEAGVYEAYNYWLFRMGDTENFMAWYRKNEEKFSEFIRWFNDNSPSINKDNLIVRE
ncbi:MAG: tetratricopeptide repeat protein [Cyclobacteriaceae bacterium]|nr:tetratricopeptide repeat protein [Cyclobacteriaceae bacterium]